jgi:hypothetical protein
MPSKAEKSRMNLTLILGITGWCILSVGMGQGNSSTISCPADTAYLSVKIDSLLNSRMDTATSASRLGIQIQFQYPNDREIMRITDSCNQTGVQCTGPDTVLEAYWVMLGDSLASNYDLYSSLSSNGLEGLKISDGSSVYATKSTILAISKKCYVSILLAYPRGPQQWVGLHPSTDLRRPFRWKEEFNLLGRRLSGPPSMNRSF